MIIFLQIVIDLNYVNVWFMIKVLWFFVTFVLSEFMNVLSLFSIIFSYFIYFSHYYFSTHKIFFSNFIIVLIVILDFLLKLSFNFIINLFLYLVFILIVNNSSVQIQIYNSQLFLNIKLIYYVIIIIMKSWCRISMCQYELVKGWIVSI